MDTAEESLRCLYCGKEITPEDPDYTIALEWGICMSCVQKVWDGKEETPWWWSP